MQLRLDLKKTVEQNAGTYFEIAKKQKRKIQGALETIRKTEEKLRHASEEKPAEKKKEQRKKRWYEKFRWFISSEGLLVIGGRDATTNEIVIKKHAEQGDLVFHTDMQGSPFFVVKSSEKPAGEKTLQEAADTTISFSRAWKLGMASGVFYVNPDQVSKQAKAGEYLTKGAFIINGKANYVQAKTNVAIGLFEGAIMAGPKEAVEAHCEKFVEIVQGEKKPSDLARMIKKLVGGEIDEIIRQLPSGGCQIKK